MSGSARTRYVCIHGHYYQPPRENPWLEAIELQESAAPYHDWNERITAECYEPNASARILDERGRIADLVNNYGRTSFNFGPTLLSWMRRERPEVYQAILRADRRSQRRFGGHGSAMAQAYNHPILPLANRRDKRTQIRWGVMDFEARFGRPPEGMWLPETGVDLETLDLMAEEGILFTILAPHQVEAVRPLPPHRRAGRRERVPAAAPAAAATAHGHVEDPGSGRAAHGHAEDPGSGRPAHPRAGPEDEAALAHGVEGSEADLAGGGHQASPVEPAWRQVGEHSVETGRAYRVPLPSGRSIAVFFYDGPASRAVAFERVLGDGGRFAERLVAPLESSSSEAPLSHIATDGESYGHHHRHGEMALAYALRTIESRSDVALINYGEYLERHPPTWEARIRENTSWSCAHGVERWRSHCGCAADPGRGWTQAWRDPLRSALDWLRDTLAEPFEREVGSFVEDPWEARDRYGRVVVERSDEAIDAFFVDVAGRRLEGPELTHALRLFELQRNLMLQYTSCGWFFDDLSGIETVQVLQYAGRAIHLADEVFGSGGLGMDLEEAFLERLEGAVSNLPEWGNGRDVYRRTVEPARVDLRKAAAHYAVSSVFDEVEEDEEVYCYRFHRHDLETQEAGGARLLAGRVDVTSAITRNSEQLTFAVLHLGNHNLAGGVRAYAGEETYEELLESLRAPFRRTDFTAVIRVLDRAFEASTYSLRSLFRDAQLRIVDTLLESSVEEAEATLAGLYEQRAPLLRFLADLHVPAPRPFVVAGEYVLNQRLTRILRQDDPSLPAVKAVLESAEAAGVPLDREAISYEAESTLERTVHRLTGTVEDTPRMGRVRALVGMLLDAGIPLDLWRVQNAFWRLVRDVGPLPPAPAPGVEGAAADGAEAEGPAVDGAAGDGGEGRGAAGVRSERGEAKSGGAVASPSGAAGSHEGGEGRRQPITAVTRDREGRRRDPAAWRAEIVRLADALGVAVR